METMELHRGRLIDHIQLVVRDLDILTEMAKLNQFLLAYFYAKVIFFMVFFGAFYLDLAAFVGLVGLSISANAGVRAPVTDVVTETEAEKEGDQEWSPTEPLVPAFTR